MDTPSSSPNPPRTGGRLGREVQASIGRQLRGYWDEVTKNPLPDRLAELTDELVRRLAQKKNGEIDKEEEDNRPRPPDKKDDRGR